MAGDRFLASRFLASVWGIPSLLYLLVYNFCISPRPTPVSRSNCRWEAPLSLRCLRIILFVSSANCRKAALLVAPVCSFIKCHTWSSDGLLTWNIPVLDCLRPCLGMSVSNSHKIFTWCHWPVPCHSPCHPYITRLLILAASDRHCLTLWKYHIG